MKILLDFDCKKETEKLMISRIKAAIENVDQLCDIPVVIYKTKEVMNEN